MRTHEQIIADIGGPAAIAKIVGAEPGAAKQWRRNKNIPSKHWKALVAAGCASWDELGTDEARRMGASTAPHQDAA